MQSSAQTGLDRMFPLTGDLQACKIWTMKTNSLFGDVGATNEFYILLFLQKIFLLLFTFYFLMGVFLSTFIFVSASQLIFTFSAVTGQKFVPFCLIWSQKWDGQYLLWGGGYISLISYLSLWFHCCLTCDRDHLRQLPDRLQSLFG